MFIDQITPKQMGDRRNFMRAAATFSIYALGSHISPKLLTEDATEAGGKGTNPPIEAFLISAIPDLHGNHVAIAIGNAPEGAYAQIVLTKNPKSESGPDGSRVILGDAIRINPVTNIGSGVIDATPLSKFNADIVPERPEGTNNYFEKNIFEGDVDIPPEFFGPDGKQIMLDKYGSSSILGKMQLIEITSTKDGGIKRICKIIGPKGDLIYRSSMQIARSTAKPATDTQTGSYSDGREILTIQIGIEEGQTLDLKPMEVEPIVPELQHYEVQENNATSSEVLVNGVLVQNTIVAADCEPFFTTIKVDGEPIAQNTARTFHELFKSTAQAEGRQDDAHISFEEFMKRILEVNKGTRNPEDVKCKVLASQRPIGDPPYSPSEHIVYPFVDPEKIDPSMKGRAISDLTYEFTVKNNAREIKDGLITQNDGVTYFGVFIYEGRLVVRAACSLQYILDNPTSVEGVIERTFYLAFSNEMKVIPALANAFPRTAIHINK